MTRHDITPVVDEIDGWHGDDHYTGPRPIPSVSPLATLLRVLQRLWTTTRWILASVLFVAVIALVVMLVEAKLSSMIKHKPQEVDHAERVRQHLMHYGAPADRAAPVADALLSAAKEHDVDLALLTAIVTVENPTLKSAAKSRAGAVGLMQVMPFWKRDRVARRRCGGTDLTNDAVNLCFGIHVLKFTMRSRRTLPGALLYYNGCRSFRAACGAYPQTVLRRRVQFATTVPAQESSE